MSGLFGFIRNFRKSGAPGAAAANVSVRQGLWGEDVAARDLEARGCRILGRRVKPSVHDRRLEIDIVAKEPGGTVLFVEVKTHKRHSPRESDLPAINRRKKLNLRRACLSWLRTTRFDGNYVFCVYEIYGNGAAGGEPDEVRFIRNVPLFPARYRFR